MSIATLVDGPEIHAASVLPHEAHRSQCMSIDGQDLRIAQYSVKSREFLQRVAGTLMVRSVERDVPLPSSVTNALGLDAEDAHALSMAKALMEIPNLYERRAILCDMIHQICSLS